MPRQATAKPQHRYGSSNDSEQNDDEPSESLVPSKPIPWDHYNAVSKCVKGSVRNRPSKSTQGQRSRSAGIDVKHRQPFIDHFFRKLEPFQEFNKEEAPEVQSKSSQNASQLSTTETAFNMLGESQSQTYSSVELGTNALATSFGRAPRLQRKRNSHTLHQQPPTDSEFATATMTAGTACDEITQPHGREHAEEITESFYEGMLRDSGCTESEAARLAALLSYEPSKSGRLTF